MDSRMARMIQEQRATLMMYQRRNDPSLVPDMHEAFVRLGNQVRREFLDPTSMLQRFTQEGYDSADNGSTEEYDSLDLDDMTYEELSFIEETVGAVNKGLNEKSISALPITQYSVARSTAADEEEQCTVCRCEFEKKHAVKQLPCGHIFHPTCIDQWLRISKKCPICSREVKQTP